MLCFEPYLLNPLIKLGIINQIRKLCEISRKYEMSPTNEKFVKEQCKLLKYNCNSSDSEVRLYKDFNATLCKECSTLLEEKSLK